MSVAPDISSFLGVEPEESPSARIKALRHGLPYEVVTRIREKLELSTEELARSVAISPRTLSRRQKEGHLNLEESDRLFRIARVFLHAVQVFESSERAARWFKRANPALDGERPIDIFDTDLGAQLVDDLLIRIEYGVYS